MRLAPIALSVACVSSLPAQSLLYRSPDLSGTWVPAPGVLQFNFLHRFYVANSTGGHKVTNFPTFTLATGIRANVGVGFYYSTNSVLVSNPYRPNEVEAFAKWRFVGKEGAAGFSAALRPAYNSAARSFDAEGSTDYVVGAVTLSGTARYVSRLSGVAGRSDVGLGVGATVRINPYVGVSADFAKLLRHDTTAAWSAALVFAIPGSPHTFSLQASKAVANTIQSGSIGNSKVLYGFEFTIPIHAKRFAPWFHRGSSPAITGDVEATVAATIDIAAMKFQHDTVVIPVGQAVRWNNTDPLGHTVTFDGGEPGSALIQPNTAYVHRFGRAGTYRYHCTPHPFMVGVVVVR
jgi:amicyanin